MLCGARDVAETVWAIDDVEITWNEISLTAMLRLMPMRWRWLGTDKTRWLLRLVAINAQWPNGKAGLCKSL